MTNSGDLQDAVFPSLENQPIYLRLDSVWNWNWSIAFHESPNLFGFCTFAYITENFID